MISCSFGGRCPKGSSWISPPILTIWESSCVRLSSWWWLLLLRLLGSIFSSPTRPFIGSCTIGFFSEIVAILNSPKARSMGSNFWLGGRLRNPLSLSSRLPSYVGSYCYPSRSGKSATVRSTCTCEVKTHLQYQVNKQKKSWIEQEIKRMLGDKNTIDEGIGQLILDFYLFEIHKCF